MKHINGFVFSSGEIASELERKRRLKRARNLVFHPAAQAKAAVALQKQ